ncbi:MAG: hypothetical protein FD180_1026 [Planctomycetota bacterium]|nr:MAG: hypothetical protein FD180_1026 [Planctomycetota bacterium]
MRTTLTIDQDIAVLLERIRLTRKTSLKAVVNQALRLGLQGMTSPARPRKPYKSPSWDVGKCLLPSLDCFGDVLEFLDAADREKPV